ncbi:MAG TPA: EamA family transporter [Solirubrobacteraceae bacterium]|nr:EamA family transporter [Solirubrobacteraceae bacterium]
MLASAGLHAFWNWLVADARDSHAVAAVAMCAGALAFAPFAVLTWDVDGSAAPYIGASAALELAYFALLATAYERADYTFVYPIARGAAPVLVLVVSVVALSADVSVGEAVGVIAITGGVLLVRGVGRGAAHGGLVLALGVAACIAAYTLVDDEGLHHAAALGYFEAVLVIAAPVYAVAVAIARGPGALRAAATPRSAVTGVAMFAAYAIALAALEIAEAAPVAALRETSVVMATVAAALFARERVPAGRVVGAVVVVAGIAAIALT